jgi:predicted MFS family arabinose efflux permease
LIALLAALATTQILGWGTTFYIPATLGDLAIAATFLSRPEIFGGITIMYVVGGVAAPIIGRRLDRHGARPLMMAGSCLAAAALALMSQARSLPVWVACWVAIGLMMPMALSSSAYVAVAQAALARGLPPRRPIAILTLATGLAISFAFPFGAWAQARFGWQGTLLLFAAINLVVCLPLHATVPRGAPPPRDGPAAGGSGRLAPRHAPRAMVLLAAAFTLQGFCSVALELHLLALLAASGVGAQLAVTLAALSGPIRVGARLLDMALARRFSALATGLGAMALLPPALGCLLLGGTGGALAFVLLWSISMGITTVARAALPLELFGAAGYGARLGRLALPISLGQALGPLAFAGLLDASGAAAVAWLGLGFALAAVAALTGVAVLVRRGG